MASTGRLTSAQRTAIQAGNAIVQKWDLHVPVGSTHAAYAAVRIGQVNNMSKDVDGYGYDRMVRAGSRKHVVWNPSPNVSVKSTAVMYAFVVSNQDNKFFVTTTNNFFYYSGGYQASPQECYIRHRIYVVLNDGSESEIDHMDFTGRITEIKYTDIANNDGEPLAAVATIICKQTGAWEELSRVWTVDDAKDVPMTYASTDLIWTET